MLSSNRIYLAIFMVVFVAGVQSCSKIISMDESPEKIVVEGMMESGANPVVILTKNISLDEHKYTIENIVDYLVIDANVRIVCDGDTTTLTPGLTDKYFPPIIYTSSKIRGESGKSYKLIVETSDGAHHLEATTIVPEPVSLDSLRLERVENTDTMYQVRVFFRDNKQETNYYKFFVKTTNDTEDIGDDQESEYMALQKSAFLSPSLSVFNDDVLADTTQFVVTRGMINYTKGYSIKYFVPNDNIVVKFTQINFDGYKFWRDIQNDITFGGMTGISSDKTVSSNISGGLGAWIGYGASTYMLSVPASTR